MTLWWTVVASHPYVSFPNYSPQRQNLLAGTFEVSFEAYLDNFR